MDKHKDYNMEVGMERYWILGTVRYTGHFEITGILPVLPSIFQLPVYRYGTVIS